MDLFSLKGMKTKRSFMDLQPLAGVIFSKYINLIKHTIFVSSLLPCHVATTYLVVIIYFFVIVVIELIYFNIL